MPPRTSLDTLNNLQPMTQHGIRGHARGAEGSLVRRNARGAGYPSQIEHYREHRHPVPQGSFPCPEQASPLKYTPRESPHPASRTHDYFILFMPLARGESALTSASVAPRNRREYLELLSNAPFPGNPLAPAGFAGREDARERIDCTKGRDFLRVLR